MSLETPYRRRVVLRDYVSRDTHVCAHVGMRIDSPTLPLTRTCICMYPSVCIHKIPSPLRATCIPREASKAIGIIERNGEARVLRTYAHMWRCNTRVLVESSVDRKAAERFKPGVIVNFATALCIAPCLSSGWILAIWRRHFKRL